MAKRLPPIEETLAAELYDYLLDFIESNGAIPVERAFWGWLPHKKFYTSLELPEHTFRYHFGRLHREGYISIEPITRSLKPLRDCRILVNR